MKRYPYVPSMVQAITVLTVLKMMTKAQTSCGSGSMNGKIMYERLPNIQLQGFDDDIVRDTAPPFMVLEKCQDLCLRDRTQINVVRACSSFDFQPGSRIATYNGGTEYEESTCYLTSESARPEGIGSLMLVPNSVHFTEVCITSSRPERECPNRRYIFERHPRKKLKLPSPDMKEMSASNRTDCEDKCLNEFSFVCRSATYDSNMRSCTLSRYTRRTHPELLVDDPDSDYLENTCLNAERRCDGLAVFIKEENKRLGGPFEVEMFTNLTLDDCQGMCVRAEKYLCRSIEYDEMSKQCTLSEEDSISQKDDIGVASSPSHHFYDFACLDSPRGSEYPDNSVTSHLFSGKKPDTAFQRYRNSRLGGEHQSEISGRSLSECLDECLRQPSFQCRSAEYSERYRTCRLTRYNQRDGMRIIYDADYDYYENLMLGGENDGGQRPADNNNSVYRPGEDRYPIGSDRFRPGRPGTGGSSGDRFPPKYPGRFPSNTDDRYPERRPPPHRYPEYDDRYPDDRYPDRDASRYPTGPHRRPDKPPYYPPSSGGKYYPPADRYDDKYGDRYGGGYRNRDRYGDRPGGDLYGNRDRYGDRPGGDLYGNRDTYNGYRYGDRYGGSGSRYDYDDFGSRYGGGTRYGTRYRNRYGGGDRYNSKYDDRYGDKYDYYGDDKNGGGKWYSRPDRRPGGRPVDPVRPYDAVKPYDSGRPYDAGKPYDSGRPYDAVKPYDSGRPYNGDRRRPISPGPDGPIYDNYGSVGGGGGNRPFNIRCDEGADNFRQMGYRQRMRKEYVKRVIYAPSLRECERECIETREFNCRSFNYRDSQPAGAYDTDDKDNCELSDRDTRDLEIENPQYFDAKGSYDFYERTIGGEADCLDVSQICNEDGMEFTLRTPEGFYGRIYTYGSYDRCFFRGNGGTLNVLRISGAQGYPECGTQRYGDTMTNIVVVQFSDYVQTGKDKRFNLTCLFRGPGEAVVSSGFIGAGSGSPIPIEYLPAENTLSSKVRLMILYQGRPTTTIAVGDPLTFRLEAQDGYNYVTDIFATNVVARDPYSGRSVQLIDRFGCPVDSYVFPELDKGRNGDSLEARFNAFKIPESNFLVFEATVRTCRDGCQPAYCQIGSGRSEPSFGKRRRRSINETKLEDENQLDAVSNETIAESSSESNGTNVAFLNSGSDEKEKINKDVSSEDKFEEKEFVREMIEVFDSREELQQEARRTEYLPETVCLTPGAYHGLVSSVMILVAILLTASLLAGLAYRRYWLVMRKNILVDRSNSNLSTSYPNTSRSGVSNVSIFGSGLQKQFASFGRAANLASFPKVDFPETSNGGMFEDPSEPIYTDPSLFERSRSLRSIAISSKRRKSPTLKK